MLDKRILLKQLLDKEQSTPSGKSKFDIYREAGYTEVADVNRFGEWVKVDLYPAMQLVKKSSNIPVV